MERIDPKEFICGGIGESQPADPEVQAICDSVKSHVEEKTGQKYDIFEAKTYKKQTVAGYNYFVKVHIVGNKHLDLHVFVGLPHTNSGPVLRRVQESTDDWMSDLEQKTTDMEPIDPKKFMVGGIGESQPADPEVQAICNSVKSHVEEQRGETYEIFEAISYKTQTVAGLNYFVKVHIGGNKHLDLVVFVGLPHTNSGPVLRSVQESTDKVTERELLHPEGFLCVFTRQPEVRCPEKPVIYEIQEIKEREPIDPKRFMLGGIGESQPADPEVQAICNSVKSHVEEKTGQKYDIFEAKTYKKQTVAGYNYFVKVHIGGNKHLDLHVFVGLPHTNSGPVLRRVQESTDDWMSDLEQKTTDMEPIDPKKFMVGGIGESQPADPEVQAICNSVKSHVEEQRGETYEIFEAISYKTQTVAGLNYFVKVHIGGNKHLDLVVFVGLPHTNSGPVLRRVQESTDDCMSDLEQKTTDMEPIDPKRFMLGGIGESQPADPEVQAICNSVKSHVEEKTGQKYDIFEAKTYKKQTVAGYNYFVKVHIGGNKHLDLHVFVGLPHTNSGPVLRRVQESTDDWMSDLEQKTTDMEPIDPKKFMVGGIGESQPADPEVQAICNSVKSHVEEQRGETYEIFEAISYKTQTVAGLNYFVKVHIGGNKHLDLVVFVGLPHTNSGPVLRSVQESTDKVTERELLHPEGFLCVFTRQPEVRCPEKPVIYEIQEIKEREPIDPKEFICGGIGESQPADPEVQAICNSVKSHVEEKTGQKYDIFEAKTYKKQTVAGYNYFVKVHIGGNKHLDLHVFVGLPHTNSGPVLRRVQESTDDWMSDLEQKTTDMEPIDPKKFMVGGIGESQPADPEVQAICNSVKSHVEEQRGETYEIFEAISYKTQTVAGLNYFVKVHIGGNKHLDLVVFVGLPHTNSGPVLRRVQESTDDCMSDLEQKTTDMEPIDPKRFMLGGIGESQPADPEVQAICNSVHIGGNKHLDLHVFVGLPHTNSGPVLRRVQESTDDWMSDLEQKTTDMEPIDPKKFMVGGIGESQPADPEVQAICNSVKSHVEEQRGETYEIFEAISYKTQTVAGLNYFVKVHIGGNKHLDLVVFVGLPHTNSGPVLRRVQESTDDCMSDLEQKTTDMEPIDPKRFMLGGIGESQPADPEVQAICNSVKSHVEEKTGQKYDIFEAKTYKKQTVAGYNYFVKVHIGGNKHLDLHVFVGLPHTNSGPVLRRVQESTDDWMSDLEQKTTDMEPIDPKKFMVGGIGESQPADPEVQAICNSVKSHVEEQRGETYEIFEAISYKTQTVAGLNYFVKVHIGGNKHLDLVVFVGLPHTNSGPVLRRVQESTDDCMSDLEQKTTDMEPIDPKRFMLGGIGESQPADPEVQAICNSVHIGGNKHLDLHVFVGLPHTNSGPVLRRVQESTDDWMSDLEQKTTDMEPIDPKKFMVGGIGESQPADPEVQAICNSVKSHVEEQRGETYEIFEAISYKTQTVAGLNYFVKVHIGGNKHLDLVVFVGLPHTNSGPVLRSVQEFRE
ncbi:uncharacterized protein LOC117378954 isoform X7 [Periophthalmus magnuspinnatus]|uniref:uncharacterized protein LOC117378954 isoform X7 n=1 Tax=Periophthalmus magnuspinnatus TaxID=409849 RepID=UPI0024366CC6|nr:uncharacterized protein LOC117378954 isoform X7 [Periophthalmus magnuspinnatus]